MATSSGRPHAKPRRVRTHTHIRRTRTQHRTRSSTSRLVLHETRSKQDVRSSCSYKSGSSVVLKCLAATDYELVRIYHPDSPVSRPLPSATAQARFQSITAAYDALRGKKPPPGESSSGARVDTHSVGAAAWRARMRRRAELNTGLDDRWKDRLMLGTVLMVSHPKT